MDFIFFNFKTKQTEFEITIYHIKKYIYCRLLASGLASGVFYCLGLQFRECMRILTECEIACSLEKLHHKYKHTSQERPQTVFRLHLY